MLIATWFNGRAGWFSMFHPWMITKRPIWAYLWMGSIAAIWARGQLGHCRHSVSTGAGESRAIHRRMGVSLVPSMVGWCVKFWQGAKRMNFDTRPWHIHGIFMGNSHARRLQNPPQHSWKHVIPSSICPCRRPWMHPNLAGVWSHSMSQHFPRRHAMVSPWSNPAIFDPGCRCSRRGRPVLGDKRWWGTEACS